jgi:hypothetical protein
MAAQKELKIFDIPFFSDFRRAVNKRTV